MNTSIRNTFAHPGNKAFSFSFALSVAVFIWCTSIFISTALAQTDQSDPLVIQDVYVLSMENDEILENQTVIIEDGQIAWTGSQADAQLPENARIITGDYYIMPGLSEMHAHVPSGGYGEQYMLDVLVMYLANGVTTIRNMSGNPIHLEFREKVNAGEIHGPRMITAGPSFSGNSVPDAESGRNRVREQAEAGYDLLKFSPGLSLEVFEATVEEAHRQNIEFSGHISYDVGLERSLEAGKGSIDHLDRYMEYLAGEEAQRPDPPTIYFGYDLTPHVNDSKIDEAARLTAEAGVWNVPTNTLLENVLNPDLTVETMENWPGMEYLPEDLVNNWAERVHDLRANEMYDEDQARRFLDIRKQITLALHRNGAGLMLGADAPQIFNPPGFSVHRELEVKVDAGLTPFEALKTGTVNVGVYLEEENKTGKIQPGFLADIVILNQNPLESIPFHDAIEGVIREGRYYDRHQLDDMLEEIRQREY